MRFPKASRRRLGRAGVWKTTVAVLGAASALAGASEARAQVEPPTRVQNQDGAGADVHLFRPAIDSKGFFGVNGADLLGKGNISLGLVLDYGRGLMPLAEGHGTEHLVEHAFQGTLQFDYGVTRWLVLGVSLPIFLGGAAGGEQAVTDIGPTGATYDDDEIDAQGLGNAAIHGKIRFLSPDTDVIGLAVVAQAGLGVAGTEDLQSEPGAWFWPQAVLEKRFGETQFFRIGVNAGLRIHTGQNAQFGNDSAGNPQLEHGVFEYSNLATGGLGLSLRLLESLDLVGEGLTTFQLGGASDAKQRLSLEALGGLKVFIEKRSFFIIGGGAGLTPGFQSPDVRGVLGAIFEPSIGDRDGDGIKDDEDDCPDDPEDFDGFEDTKADSPPGQYGCPDPDNDKDGIPDVRDRCRDNPEDMDGDEDEDGCPEGSDGDRDGDGILDSRDKCPDVPEDKDGFEDKDGCPDPDNDKDGIPDAEDDCPNDPEDKDGFKDEDGCPDPDNDGDGIPDAKDKCPNKPETFNGVDDADGCPDEGKVIVQGNDVIILEKVQFKTGSAEILPESFGIIDAVAATLKGHPEFKMLEVQGHADERGSDDLNQRLTAARANSVVEALIKRGVAKSRLNPMGYGEYCPLDPASNAAAWEKNRRVEFKIVRTDQGRTDVVLGCPKATEMGIKSTTR